MKDKENVDVQMESLVDASKVAGMLGLSVRTVRDMAARRELPVYKIGRCSRFLVREILEWRDQKKVPSL